MTRKELEKLQASDDETFAGLTERHPKQARSRETLGRLLDAAESLLTEGGLEAATVPAIADRAGLSVGVVYRRFPDKDALLRAVYLRFFGRLAELNRQNLAIVASREYSLTEMTRKMVEGMVKGYRLKRGILRALVLYARTHQDAEFRRASQELNQNTTAAIAALLMTRRSEIHHPKPESAIEFGLLAIASVLHAVILEEEPMHGITTQHNLEEELVRLFFGYLGIKEVESGRLARK
ncbi:MAG: TetR/AcrR family transcriptional regulator [Thermoanaerobaculia bacterium]